MRPNRATPPEPLWSDNTINELIDRRVKSYGGNAKVAARRVAYTMRDDYEAERAAAQARIAELEAALAERGEWEPVPDSNLVPTITDGEMWAYERDSKLGKAIAIRRGSFHGDIILADGYAVCRRVPVYPAAQRGAPPD